MQEQKQSQLEVDLLQAEIVSQILVLTVAQTASILDSQNHRAEVHHPATQAQETLIIHNQHQTQTTRVSQSCFTCIKSKFHQASQVLKPYPEVLMFMDKIAIMQHHCHSHQSLSQAQFMDHLIISHQSQSQAVTHQPSHLRQTSRSLHKSYSN